MPSQARSQPRGADTIRILVATDSHVGYQEKDARRGDDSWKTFHEVMCLAKEHDVDMVLHAGDLFHENKPSRKSLYHVMRSIRMNCLGDKPCELEMLSDASENFGGIFDHVNYEDEDINVAIPVFAIHGNHDDPSGEGSYSPLDLLQASGLVNYFGRTPEMDKIAVRPILLQKGGTKLALYGLSNVRDERLFHTWKDGNVRFFQPGTQKDEWFNIMSVHQNHSAHTPTSYLPEDFLPHFMDLVVWGHEHECLIEPRFNPEMGFHVMQPGSSIATSLMPGEAVPKHVAILSITGKEFQTETIRLRTVRPFIMKEIVLAEEKEIKKKELWRVSDNRAKITQHLTMLIEELIEQANREWLELQDDQDEDDEFEVPLPLVRLRVEYTAPEPGEFKIDNPQRFSNFFIGKIANQNDVVQFHRKKKTATKTSKSKADMPDASVLEQFTAGTIKVDKLVKEYLSAQTLTILPQNSFGDAVSQFVDKDDRNAMLDFVKESLEDQFNHLLSVSTGLGDDTEEMGDLGDKVLQHKEDMETLFDAGKLKKFRESRLKAKPLDWDSDDLGHWADDPSALIRPDEGKGDNEGDNALTSGAAKKPAARGRGKAADTTRKTSTAAKKTSASAAKSAGKRKAFEEEDDDDDEDEDVIMVSDNDEESDDAVFVPEVKKAPAKKAPLKKAPTKAPARAKSPAKKVPAARAKASASKQSILDFSQGSVQRSQPTRTSAARSKKAAEPQWRCCGLCRKNGVDVLSYYSFQVPTQRPGRRVQMSAIPNHRSCPLPSHPNTLICLPFSCSALLVPHCCCSAFWIAVARFSIYIIHRSRLGYVAVTTFDLPHDSLAFTAASAMSLAYKVEELLALRDSVSESAVSLDRFADEDVIKEHVLRPSASASANLASRSSGRSLRPPVAQPLAAAAPQKRPSPTPSIKRGKAEKLLKEHGSPPGMRVTAGGRVVPSDLPPLGTSRFPDNTFQAPLRMASGNTMSLQTQSSNNTGARIDVVGGQPVIFIGDRMFALPAVNTNSTTSYSGSANMEPATKPSSDLPALSSHDSVSGLSFAPPRASSTSPFTGLDLPTLKAQQALKRQELRTVEQTEVLQAGHQNDAWRAGMIERKRGLIVELDALRKSISAFENENASSIQSNSFLDPIGTMPNPSSLPTYVPQVPQSTTQPMYNFQAGGFPAPMIYPPPYSAFPNFAPAEPAPFVAPQTNPPHSPGSASRRSHAIEIKPPQEGTSKQTLNPKSPTYEPTIKSNGLRNATPPTPSPPKRSPWRVQDAPQSNGVQRALSQNPSFSSHSSTRLAPRAMEAPPSAIDRAAAVPATPDKHWPASPWNGGHSEAFGQQRSSSSLRQNATVQLSEAATSNHAASREDTEPRSGAQEDWLFSSKASVHAGYDHIGMPDSPEVLQGYIQGLLQFLADEPTKGRFDIAIRDHLRSHDSQTPMTFNHNIGLVANRENIRARDIHDVPTKPTMQYPATASLFPDKLLEKSAQDKDSFARQFSGAQLQNRSYGTSFSGGYNRGPASTMRPSASHRMSGLDGAMDDLTGLIMETNINDNGPSIAEAEETTASCFRAKGKQKAPVSPAKSSSNGRDNGVSSPNPSSSPKKSGEHSPTKAKLEHVTNKFRRNKKDDPRTMSPEDKMKRSEKWRTRFQYIKKVELEEIEAQRRNSRN
ncbi:Mre11 DNA-binding presumed domain-containing protein [Phaeosphaeria sp. MPI-PUGE-AT-0046c]|nr:Mre11 DNA-binding presumed domain-containing protein [Phaeosphaeria sp. MPI-PUGE-AT-0046c]